MKKLFFLGLMALALVFGTSPVGAYTINTPPVDVGDVDIFIAKALLGSSGDSVEINWVNSVLGTSFTIADLVKTNTPEGAWIQTNEATDVYAFDLVSGTPQYFYIKVGVGANDPEYSHFLFQNIGSLSWAVIDLQNTNFEIKNVGKLSHIGELGQNSVPEPGTLLMLGLGLMGMAWIRRKKG
jgi:hypothetical protein